MTTYQQKKIELIPQGYYPATITKVETVNGDYGQQEKFHFDLGGNRELLAWASGNFSTKSKLYRWVRNAIFGGQAIPDAYNLDTGQFVGRKVILNVTQRVNTDGTFNKVEDILPASLGQQPEPMSLFSSHQPSEGTPPEPDGPAPWETGDI